MNPELLAALEDCGHLTGRLLAQLNTQWDDAKRCMDGRLLDVYLTGIERARESTLVTREECAALRARVRSGL